ncbi:hypothetical protein [Acidocella sp.]|jgi:hypothetical protein|uniref:hypothetical protein n=1 Tax=Acidocella sp. TaxID=50710 RepID=UPI002F422C6E
MTFRPLADTLSDADFAKAMKARAWRTAAAPDTASSPANTTSSTTTPPPPAAHKATKPALAMTDAEYEIARRNRAWRNS